MAFNVSFVDLFFIGTAYRYLEKTSMNIPINVIPLLCLAELLTSIKSESHKLFKPFVTILLLGNLRITLLCVV